MPALPSKTLLQNGAFVIGPPLGRGGFGITYKGGDVALRRLVAIKEFFPQGSARDGMRLLPHQAHATIHAHSTRGFLEEARTLARFNHDGIVRVFSVFEENNTAYMVMEFLEGQTLSQLLAARGGRLPEAEVLEIARQILGALDEIHRAEILHRDIKPDNIIIRQGRAVLVDFGTARALTENAARMTQLVTPGYAPLEQYASQARRAPATDLYALAATLYHLLCGVMPVAATDRAADISLPDIRAQLSQLSPFIGAAIMRALEMKMDARPQSAREFLSELESSAPHFSPALNPAHGSTPGGSTPVPRADENAAASMGAGAIALTLHQKLARHASSVNALVFTPDGMLWSAGQDKIIYGWNPKMRAVSAHLSGHTLGVLALAISPDGGWLAGGGLDGTIRLWDATTRASLAVLSGHGKAIRALAFSPTERVLVSSGEEGVWLWDMNSGHLKAQLTGAARALAFSLDGKTLAAADDAGNISLWNTRSWQRECAFAAHAGGVKSLAFGPTGSTLLSCGADRCAKIWDVSMANNAQCKATFAGHNGSVNAAAFSPDGNLVATGGDDFSVRVWDAQSGTFLRRHTQHHDRVNCVAFSLDRNISGAWILASGSRDKSINICRCAAGGESYWENAGRENAHEKSAF